MLSSIKLKQSLSQLTKRIDVTKKRSFFRIVLQGKEAYRLILGKNPKHLKPGLYINIPILHKFIITDMRERILPVEVHAYTKDNVPVIAVCSLYFKITDLFKACFQIQDYEKAAENIGSASIRGIIGQYEYDYIGSNRNALNIALRKDIDTQCLPWGVECTRFEIQEFRPQNEHVKKQMEKQMEAERARRENDLNTSAAIRTAEGRKRAAELDSEGGLTAAKNKSLGDLELALRKSEGDRQLLLAEAKARSEAFSLMQKATGMDPLNVAQFMTEMNRIQKFGDIAKGSSNNTYFLNGDIMKAMSLFFEKK